MAGFLPEPGLNSVRALQNTVGIFFLRHGVWLRLRLRYICARLQQRRSVKLKLYFVGRLWDRFILTRNSIQITDADTKHSTSYGSVNRQESNITWRSSCCLVTHLVASLNHLIIFADQYWIFPQSLLAAVTYHFLRRHPPSPSIHPFFISRLYLHHSAFQSYK